MASFDRMIGLAFALAALGGFVDAIGFISLGGFFVAFMSGNSTRLGVEIIRANPAGIAIAGGVIALFVTGVIAAALIARAAGRWRRMAVLGWSAIGLAAAAWLDATGQVVASTGALVLAMASINSVFQRNGEITVAVTYMTGTLVKMGQQIANALVGAAPPFAWLRHGLLWLGLVCGALAGTAAYDALGLQAIWIAAGFSAILAPVSLALPVDAD